MFVQTSNMTYWKRLDLLVDAFAEVRRQRPARLLIVGEGPGRPDAEDRIRRLGLEADVEAVGWVDDPLQYAALGRRRVGELSPEASANALIGFLSQRLGVAA